MNKKMITAAASLVLTASVMSGCGQVKISGLAGLRNITDISHYENIKDAMMSACGQKEEYLVNIEDNGQKTEMLVSDGESVAGLLADAGIELGDKDEISESTEETVSGNMDIEIGRYAKVTVCDSATGSEQEVELTGGKVADAVKEAGITVAGHDYLDAEEDAWLTDGMTIHVIHRVEVTVTCDGKTETKLTEGKTVADYLQENSITLGDMDRITPDTSTALEEGTEIVIQRVGVKEEQETETIAYSTTTEDDSTLAKGKTKVKTEGVNGEKVITYKVTYVDGKEESREKVSEEVTKEPVNEVILNGTYEAKKKSSSSSSSSGSSSSGSSSSSGKTIVSKEYYDDCDGSGHGTMKITYSDGTVKYKDY